MKRTLSFALRETVDGTLRASVLFLTHALILTAESLWAGLFCITVQCLIEVHNQLLLLVKI